MSEKIEYRVRPVTRYIVTRYEQGPVSASGSCCGGSSTKGEFDHADTAYAVAYALAKHEHEQKGWPLGDVRMQYPAPIPAKPLRAPRNAHAALVDGFPRRSRIDLHTPAERAIRAAVEIVETAGAHPLLTDAVELLHEARECVADFVERDERIG